MRKYIYLTLFFLISFLPLSAHTYFVAVDGDDSNYGTKEAPYATLKKAQLSVTSGDTVYIREGTYKIKENQIMDYSDNGVWAYVFDMSKSGNSDSERIYYSGYQNERPVFDLSKVKPEGRRVIVFHVQGSFLHFNNFEVIGTQVTIKDHTQSECFRNNGGNNNIYENLAMHDGMAIGFYLSKGANNLILNCDAYNNYDSVSQGGSGGNVDGFGAHHSTASSPGTGNAFRGCRAWYNSDDGFDLIGSLAAVTIENCWAFYNGYKPNSTEPAADGTGFKAGGYGMGNLSENEMALDPIPMHVVENSIAYQNKNRGFYANHHLGGLIIKNNSGYRNPSNFDMTNRISKSEASDVPGYGHIIKNNLSLSPRKSGLHIYRIDEEKSTLENNSFLPLPMKIDEEDFISLDESELKLPRKPNGDLPEINFLKPRPGTELYQAKIGYSFEVSE